MRVGKGNNFVCTGFSVSALEIALAAIGVPTSIEEAVIPKSSTISVMCWS
jgi:hypothetical protein